MRWSCITRKVPLWAVLSYVSMCIFVVILTQHGKVVEVEKIVDIGEHLRQVILQEQLNTCGLQEECGGGSVPFSLTSGKAQDKKPKICYNGSYQEFPSREMGRGMNLLLIDNSWKIPRHERVFDLYSQGDSDFLSYLKSVKEGNIIFIATYDDASVQLSNATKTYLRDQFGSREIINMNYRSSWVFAGQKGREHGVPYEAITQSSKDNAWADVASVKGCLSFPVRRSEGPVCGMQSACSENHTAVNVLSSSLENTALLPVSFCVNGRRNFINTGSRGLNFLVYDLHWRSVMMSQTFDTHESEAESERLVKFLESVGDNQLLIGAVYDDASRWLTVNAKDTLERFGALKIHDLTFRGMWVFVGRRGVEGASPYEELNKATSAKDKKDAKAELSACIPDRIDGFQRLHPAERRRKEFCSKYPSYTDLCSEEGKRVLKQIPLDDLSLSKNQAYNTPILVIGGADLQSLQRCMDSLLAIPGLNRDNVYVVLEGHFQEPSDLVTLYGFRVKEQPSQKNYHENFIRALEFSLTFDVNKPYVIVLEPYLEVSPDFLRYFSQTIHLLERDRSLLTVSAWNENGYAHSSGDPQLFYRTQAFPGFGWVLSRSIWPEMKEFKFSCCDVPTWKGWFQGGLMRGRETVVPDLSRVKRHLPPGFTMETPFMRGYLKDRVSSNDSSTEPRETFKLTYEQYEKEIKFLIGRSRLFDTSILNSCLEEGTRLTTGLSFDKSAIYAVYFQQISPTDVSVLVKLASCFGLFISDEIPFRSWHDSVVRFTSHKSQFILIGSKSKHFGMKPDSAEVVG